MAVARLLRDPGLEEFKTNVLKRGEAGTQWYYDPVTPGAARVEWDQS